jgi:hypothetical protein
MATNIATKIGKGDQVTRKDHQSINDLVANGIIPSIDRSTVAKLQVGRTYFVTDVRNFRVIIVVDGVEQGFHPNCLKKIED